MSYDLQPGGPSYRPPAAPVENAPQFCEYCGAPLSEFYYFCLACATPYKNVDTVIAAARPRQLTDEELVRLKAPHVKTVFWTYFSVIIGTAIFSYVVFREDRPDLQLLLSEIVLFAMTVIFGIVHRRALSVQLKTFGFNRLAAYVGLAALAPLLLVDYGYHSWLVGLGGEGDGMLSDLREVGVSEAVLVVTFCVTPALLEEIAFRGLIQHWLQTAIAPWKALVLASFLFGIMHLTALSLPYLFAVGLLLGWVKQRTNSLYPSMLIHFLHNWVVIEYFDFG